MTDPVPTPEGLARQITDPLIAGMRDALAAVDVSAFRPPAWSPDPPTEPGWYWFRPEPGHRASVEKVYRDREDGVLCIASHTDYRWTVAEWHRTGDDSQWAGPLQPPA